MSTRRPTHTPMDPNKRGEAPRVRAGARRAGAPPRLGLTAESRRAMIAESAYLRAERRGFEPGHETEDWLAAEAEVDALVKDHGGPPQ
jgi:hypothetical protein